MARKFFLFLSDHLVAMYQWQRGHFSQGEQLELGEKGLGQFNDYLDQVKLDGPVYLIIDVTEEELHEAILPKLMGSNRHKVIRQRADRIFRNTPFTHYRFQGRVEGEKNKERAMFMGLTDPERITPWVEILLGRRAEIAGIWSLPLLCLDIFHRVLPKNKAAILMSPNSGGLRQIFVQNGQVKISRMSHLPLRSPEDIMVFIHGEVARLQGYLASLRLVNHNDVLEVYLLCHQELMVYINQSETTVGQHVIHTLDAEELAVDQGLEGEMGGRDVDMLFGQFLLKRRIPNHYAQPSMTRIHRLAQVRVWLKRAALLIFLGGLGVGLTAAGEGYLASAQLSPLTKKADEAQLALRKVAVEGFEKRGGGQDMVAAAKVMQKISQLATDPKPAMILVSRVLNDHEKIWIDSIGWDSAPKDIAAISSSLQKRGEPPNMPTFKPPLEQAKDSVQAIRFQGQVYPFNGSVQEAQSQVEGFVNALRSLPEVLAVETEQMPMDANQNSILQSSTLTTTQQSKFILRVILRLEGGEHG